jgi:membrane carboxypeptidase/penicillin-binding protein
MGAVYKVLLALAALALLAAAGVCGWLFVYTGDLPDTDHLSQFAPSARSVVSDSCLAGSSVAIPFEHIGKPFQDALASAEPTLPFSDLIAASLLCNRRETAGRYQLDAFRLGWHLRRRFSEQQLFTIYANRLYFGSGTTGVENASKMFFRKEADALSVEEAALLAGLLRAPNYLSPYAHPEAALARRNKVLEAMVVRGKLSASEAARAEASPIVTQPAQPTE